MKKSFWLFVFELFLYLSSLNFNTEALSRKDKNKDL